MSDVLRTRQVAKMLNVSSSMVNYLSGTGFLLNPESRPGQGLDRFFSVDDAILMQTYLEITRLANSTIARIVVGDLQSQLATGNRQVLEMTVIIGPEGFRGWAPRDYTEEADHNRRHMSDRYLIFYRLPTARIHDALEMSA